jgi:hypothetical protein
VCQYIISYLCMGWNCFFYNECKIGYMTTLKKMGQL